MAKDEQQRREMGDRIRELRESRGYKQQYVADYVGVSLRQYQFWQAGDNEPSQDNLEKLAELFGVTPQFILRGDTPSPLTSPSIEERLDEIREAISQLAERLDLAAANSTDLAAGVFERIDALERTIQGRAQRRRHA
jgi:transcriptional regulator with XRE-family HTH domain